MKLVDLYKSILATAKLYATEDGCIDQQLAEEKTPAMVKGKRLVLPTPEHLANPNWENRVVFHPLSENVMKAESDVLSKYRAALNIRFNYTVTILATELLRIAASTGEHAKLTPEQSEFLSHVKDVDQKTLNDFKSLCAAMPLDQTQKCFVSIYLKRSGTVHGKPHQRCGIVSFPLYAELAAAGKSKNVFGVTLRAKDIKSLMNLFEYLWPGIGEPEHYNVGSDSRVAPNLEALMKAAAMIASPLNAIIELFRNKFGDEEANDMLFEAEWVETFDNLSVMIPEIRMVPMQAGNEGKSATKADEVTSPAQNPVPQVPQQAMQPWQSALQPQMQPMFNNQAMMQPMQPPAPINTGAGLDFSSVLNANPVLRAQIAGMGHAPQMQPNNGPRSHTNIPQNNWQHGPTTGWGGGGGWTPGGGNYGGGRSGGGFGQL